MIRRREFITLVGGAAGSWPLAARAQHRPMPVVGYLSPVSPDPTLGLWDAFLGALAKGGYVEGRNVAIEFGFAKGRFEQLPALAHDLINRKVAVIVANTTVAALAAKRATSTIPIVFVNVGPDPVALGLVNSFNRPGGNVTGVSTITTGLLPKRLELLCQLAPAATTIAVLTNPNNPNSGRMQHELTSAAASVGRRLVVIIAKGDAELDAAFSQLSEQRVGALLVDADPFLFAQRHRVIALAARHSIPTSYQSLEEVAAGGLISYGPIIADALRQAAGYVARILAGEQATELPVIQPTKFALAINLKTAKTLGIDVPPTLLAIADEVIE